MGRPPPTTYFLLCARPCAAEPFRVTVTPLCPKPCGVNTVLSKLRTLSVGVERNEGGGQMRF